MKFADERLNGTGVRCFVTPGNDDFWEIDRPIQESSTVEFVEGRCVRLDDDHEMLTTGVSNITPWASPRELSEADLGIYLERMFKEVDDPTNLIVVVHPPPLGTALDRAPAIDEEFRVQAGSGGLRMTHVGSSAVRTFIEEHRPLLGLHGHVHESKASEKIGRTLCLNPGSEYTDGVLCGALVTLNRDKVRFQFVAG